MKTLMPAPCPSGSSFDPQAEYPQDVQQLVSAAQSQGYRLSPRSAAEIWVRYSDESCASWLMVDGSSDADLVSTLLKYATVIDTPEPTAPPPPDGYATWLDYAVTTMDTRMPQLDQIMQESAIEHSREAMSQAVQAELAYLRRLAGLVN
jgi:hypothetical protein